jgi:hypothetical protein
MNDNKLIAEFMGFSYEKNIGYYDNEMLLSQCVYDLNGGNCFDELQFHTSWDWLMPVVDKIESMRGVFRRGGMTKGGQQHNATDTKYVIEYGMHDKVIAHVYANSRIDAEYQAVVEFIKEYNLKS